MPALMRTKARHLNSIAKQIRRARRRIFAHSEELLLIVETRPPRQVRANLQVFALAMPRHVRSMYAFRGRCVMRTPRRVNVMIPAPPAKLRRINPALHLER